MPVADLSRAVGGLAGGLVGQKRGRGDDWAMSLPPPGIVLRDGKKDRMHRPAGALVGCVWCGSVGEVVDGHVSQDIGHLAVRGSGFGLLGCVWCGGGWEVLWEGAGAAGGTG